MQLLEQEQLFVFQQAIRTAGLDETFENFGEYTLFAPSEAAMYGEFITFMRYTWVIMMKY